jgi:hypothetical protein
MSEQGNLNGFNPQQEKANASNVIPAGDYDLIITACQLKATASGLYQQIHLECQVMNGEYQNRKVFEHLSFSWIGSGQPNDNQKKAVQIGRGKFAKVCEAVGLAAPKDTTELVGKTFRGKLKIRKQDGFDDQNEIAKASPRPTGGPAPAASGPMAGRGGW